MAWLAVSLLFYGISYSVSSCDAADGCDRYAHSALTSVVDVPGYLLGSILADTRLGRRLTAALALIVGGFSLLMIVVIGMILPPASAQVAAEVLTLVGKLCAAAGFIQAYLFPAEVRLHPLAVAHSLVWQQPRHDSARTTVRPCPTLTGMIDAEPPTFHSVRLAIADTHTSTRTPRSIALPHGDPKRCLWGGQFLWPHGNGPCATCGARPSRRFTISAWHARSSRGRGDVAASGAPRRCVDRFMRDLSAIACSL